ncbi:MAG: glycosyltransferase family 2 protein [Limisphaerales bacterium]
MKSVCLAILNYNGKKHLEHLLPTACAAAKKFPDTCAVVVLDNQSTDGDVAWIKHEFPFVQTIVAPKNDFLFSYNSLAQTRSEEVLVLLNNDLKVNHDYIAPLVRHFESPDVFSVSSRSYDWNGAKVTSGPACLTFKNGFYSWNFDIQHQKACYTLFTSGGSMAVDRKKFIELGGFNRLFAPAYCEDLDLCFRAWRHGWRCIYEPDSVVWHRGQATWSDHSNGNLSSLELRSLLLMQWSTFPMHKGRWQRLRTLVKLFIGSLFSRDSVWITTYPATLLYWLGVRRRYLSMKVNDRELSQILSQIEDQC